MTKLYKFKSIDATGRIRHDTLTADNMLDLEQRLSSMGMDLINGKPKTHNLFSFTRKRINRAELINFTFQMQQLTKSGVSILDSLSDLKKSSPNNQTHEVLAGIIDKIKSGKTFSEALATFPEIFDSVYVALIKVGEQTGRLAEVMHDIAESLKWHDEIIAHTKKIMIYPAFVTLVIIAVISYLMIFLVPQLIPFIENLGGTIPLHTRALITTSQFLGHYWYLIFGLPIGLFIVVRFFAKHNSALAFLIDDLKLKIYIFGPIALKTKLARFSNYFAMMYSSGLTVLDSLTISELLMGNRVLEQSIRDIHKKISNGEQISESFASVKIYPPLIIRMLKVGETTGALDESLLNISYFYNRQVKESIDKMESAITPMLSIIMGGVMMWIMSAVLGPIYDSLTHMQF